MYFNQDQDDRDDRENNMDWKKIAMVILAIIGGTWIMREIVFYQFIGTFKNIFSTFTTKFDEDQNTIHNIIEDNFKQQRIMQEEMDRKDKEFHEEFERGMNSDLEYMRKNSHVFKEENEQPKQ